MEQKRFLSTTKAAELLGISRIAVYQRIKKGQLKAIKAGRSFIIDISDLGGEFRKSLTKEEDKEIRRAVKKVVKQYGETLRLLGET